MKLKLHLFIFFILLTFSALAQEPELVVKVSKTELALNERLRVEFSIQSQGADDFQAPNFKDFKLLNKRPMIYTGQKISNYNGKITRIFNVKYSFILEPKRQGNLIIAPASIVVDGKTLRSKPIKLKVTKAIQKPKNPNDPSIIAGDNVHIVAHISNPNPYVGEAIYVEYRVYVRDVSVKSSGNYDLPKYEGFWSQKITGKNNGWQKTTYDGKEYEYAVLEKALLIPTKSGKLYIDPITTDLIVGIPVKRRDFFGNVFTRIESQVRKTFSSGKRVVDVQELPTENRPASFNGAVGDFDYSVILSKKALKANESSQIKVAVSGVGNLKSFKLPKIEMPAELEVYEPERKDKATASIRGLKGYLWENYTIVPQYKGKYKIPSTEFSYFNPKDKKYYTITSDDLVVDVLEGKEMPKTAENAVQKEDVKSLGDEFRFIQTKSEFHPKEKSNFFNSTWFYLLLLLPLLAIPIGIFIHKKEEIQRQDIKGNKARNADKLAKKYLAEAQQNLGKKEAFYESLECALHNYLKSKLGVETSDISREKITELLSEKGVDSVTISSFINVFTHCDFARYTPTTDVQMQSEYQKAKEVIMQLDKQL